MAKEKILPIHQLILDNLPATGGVPRREFIASLPPESQQDARSQIQTMKLNGKIASWMELNDAGEAVFYIGLAANKPPKVV